MEVSVLPSLLSLHRFFAGLYEKLKQTFSLASQRAEHASGLATFCTVTIDVGTVNPSVGP